MTTSTVILSTSLRAPIPSAIITKGTRDHFRGHRGMGSATEASTFNFDAVAAVDADWLRQTAASLRVSFRSTTRELFTAGSMLRKAQRRLGRKYWRPWLENEAGIALRTAARFLAVARVFEKVPPEVLDRFTPTALYTLSEPGTSQSLREYSVEFANDGNQVTATLVKEWLEAYRENPKASIRLATKDAPVVVDPDDVFGVENWRLLRELIGTDGTVHLSASSDSDPQLADSWIIGIYTRPATASEPAVRRTFTHSSLERVLLTLCGKVREKACRKCKEVKPLNEFCARRDKPDGKNDYCAACERKRVAKFMREKHAKSKVVVPLEAACIRFGDFRGGRRNNKRNRPAFGPALSEDTQLITCSLP
jgi:hypothetical protein